MTLDRINRGSAAAVGFLLVSGIFVALAIFAKVSLSAPAIDADRAAEQREQRHATRGVNLVRAD